LSEAITRNAFFTVPGTAGRERRAKVALVSDIVNAWLVVNGKGGSAKIPVVERKDEKHSSLIGGRRLGQRMSHVAGTVYDDEQ